MFHSVQRACAETLWQKGMEYVTGTRRKSHCGWSRENQREPGVAQVRLEEEQGLTFQGLVSSGKEVSLSGGHWDAVVASSVRGGGKGDMVRFALWRGAEGGQNGWA